MLMFWRKRPPIPPLPASDVSKACLVLHSANDFSIMPIFDGFYGTVTMKIGWHTVRRRFEAKELDQLIMLMAEAVQSFELGRPSP